VGTAAAWDEAGCGCQLSAGRVGGDRQRRCAPDDEGCPGARRGVASCAGRLLFRMVAREPMLALDAEQGGCNVRDRCRGRRVIGLSAALVLTKGG
jgi:hypothetical protein